jgi:hypothetical protein
MSSASGSRPKVNLRSTAVKRIMQEAAELAESDEDDFVAAPLEVGPLAICCANYLVLSTIHGP